MWPFSRSANHIPEITFRDLLLEHGITADKPVVFTDEEQHAIDIGWAQFTESVNADAPPSRRLFVPQEVQQALKEAFASSSLSSLGQKHTSLLSRGRRMIVAPVRIIPQERTVEATLNSGFYVIPRFQRPYSWEIANVEDFWNDIFVLTGDADYFIGSFVVYTNSAKLNTHFVVDGQQRLTTITLILAALRKQFTRLGEPDLAAGVQKLIERQDIDYKPQYILQPETDDFYLHEHIQKAAPPELVAPAGVEKTALSAAFEFIKTQFDDEMGVIASKTATKRVGAKQLQRCKAIRDRLLRLQLILISLDTEDDAYLIFETLNTRGKNLHVSDLVKNLVARLIPQKNKNVDVAKTKWRAMARDFDDSDSRINIDGFLLHAWLSQNPYTSTKRLYRDIRTKIGSSETKATAYLDALLADAKLYVTILEPTNADWSKPEYSIRESLYALTVIFRVVQPTPLLLSVLRCYQDGTLARTQVIRTLAAMENFHAQFTAVSKRRTGGGTGMMYAKPALLLNNAKSKDDATPILNNFTATLKTRVPTEEEFIANFMELKFLDMATRQKPIVFYILQRINEHYRDKNSAPVEYATMTIEHIAAQSSTDVSKKHRGMMGNMILVSERLNGKLGKKPFLSKQPLLRGVDIVPGDTISTATQWGESEIEARTAFMARTAYRHVFKF